MRRPPQLWEQRLSRTTAILGAGGSSSGDATALVSPSPAPGSGGGTEPAPVSPPAGAFTTPSTPTLIGAVQGINVVWNGLNANGDLWPSDTSYVEVHMSTAGTGFTPDASTLKGRLVRPGGLAVVGLTSGTTYYFRLRGADPSGNYTSASAAASGMPGLITAPDIAANAINANTIVAGTITGWSINSAYLSGGTVSGGYITSGTIDSSVIRTASSGARVIFNENVSGLASISFYNSSGTRVMYMQPGSDRLALFGDVSNLGNKIFTTDFDAAGDVKITGDIEVDGANTNTSTSVPNLRINTTTGVIKQTTHANSAQRFKHDIIPLTDTPLADAVDTNLLGDPMGQALDPVDVLSLVPVQYRRNESPDVVVAGFIADDVEAKFPTAVTYDEAGQLETIDVRGIVAGLLAVVQQQQATITDLRTRIEALEA